MELIEIKTKEQLNNFLSVQEHSAFAQSWEWGEFNAGLGNKIMRFGVEEEGELVAVIMMIEKKLPLGMKYWYAPRGPVINYQLSIINYQLIFNFLILEISGLAKQEGVIFLRFEPDKKLSTVNCKLSIVKTIDLNPAKTLLLDLTKSEEELLKEMHEKTRYNIRLAEKKGVVVAESENLESDFEEFWRIMEETRERDKFRLHEKKYYQQQLRITNYELRTNSSLPTTNYQLQTKLFLAKHDGKIIAGNIVAFFGDTVTYVHGASSNASRNLMAPYALQWQCLKLAKNLGFKYYDFHGIDEKKWPGVTRFKKGFVHTNTASAEFDYAGTWDAVFKATWYNVYQWMRKVRRLV